MCYLFVYSAIDFYQYELMDIYFILWVLIQYYLIFLFRLFHQELFQLIPEFL